jgi:DNA invertase Pin-like site-specific DNA recombinase
VGRINREHLERKAFVYVRQSSLAQVQHHQESTRRQYQLRDRATRLGWPEERIEVVDEDQGRSGTSAEHREGFRRIVSEVAMGQAGAILGLDASRLARSCADWYRLLEVATLTGTLIVDEEGVYDPINYNDRLLLGLKGTLSEAEGHFLKQRMIGGRRTKARRGKFRIRLHAGYIWDSQEEQIRMDPDEQVRDAVNLFFRCFSRIGTALGTVRYFHEHHLEFPRRDGFGSLQVPVTWGPLSVARALQILRSPTYAGIYAYDRHNPEQEDPEDPCAGGRIWKEGSHAGYIGLDDYWRNVARLASNRTFPVASNSTTRAREGRGLLQGIVFCGLCGRRMGIGYTSRGDPVYSCRTAPKRSACQHINGRHVDRVVTQVLLQALSRQQLQLALKAAEKIRQRAQELEKQWGNRIEAARYEADKAARRYYQVEPENRLVARTLEDQWNKRLEEIERLEKEYEQARQKAPLTITPEQRERMMRLAEDLPALWTAPTTQDKHRKELLRILLEDVTLRNQDEPWSIEVAIRWKSGIVTRHQAQRLRRYSHTTPAEIIERIEELYEDYTDKDIARILNEEGYRSGYGNAFTMLSVSHLRSKHGMMPKKATPKRPKG